MAEQSPNGSYFKIQRKVVAAPHSETARRLLAAQDRLGRAGQRLGMTMELTEPDTWHITLLRAGTIRYALENTTRPGLTLAGLREVLTAALPNPDGYVPFKPHAGYGRDASTTTERIGSAYGLQIATPALIAEKRTLEGALADASGVAIGPSAVRIELGRSPDERPEDFSSTIKPELMVGLHRFRMLAGAVEFVPLPPLPDVPA